MGRKKEKAETMEEANKRVLEKDTWVIESKSEVARLNWRIARLKGERDRLLAVVKKFAIELEKRAEVLADLKDQLARKKRR
jgi:hypothetical protein